jgi:hypothetical protein
MAIPKRPYGKDSPERFIDSALTGGSGPSEGCHTTKIDRPNQSIETCVGMDNIKLVMPIKSSILDTQWAGSLNNLSHSLTGTSAVNEGTGAKGGKSTVYPNH